MRQVEIARSLLGVPWLHQGRDPTVGIDCICMCALSYEVPLDLIPADYSRDPHDKLLTRELHRWFGQPVSDGPRVGDLIDMAWGRVERHVAIVGDYRYGGLTIIHTDSILGEVTEHPFDFKWQRRLCHVYRREVTANE